jgi:undecaprenyl-diphosphatase
VLPFYQLLLLSLVQGLTEFIPVSSSAHLAILPNIFHWQDQGLMMDVAVHFGTLFSVMLYFRKDVAHMVLGAVDTLRFQDTDNRRLFLQLVVATIPLVIAGAAVSAFFGHARQIEIMAWTSIGFGLLLYVVDKKVAATRVLADMTYKTAFLIGLGQCLAVIPGTSRAGSSTTALRALGFDRVDTARFSCFLSIPAVIAASTLMGYKLTKVTEIQIYSDVILAACLSFVAGYIAIDFMMRWVQRSTYTVFVFYRICLGILLLVWVYWR